MNDKQYTEVILGIDTSNYTTSAALCLPSDREIYGGFLLKQVKQLLPVANGARGLRQSDALFTHTVQLPELLERLFESVKAQNIRLVGIGYSSAPRDTEGSYMPCFLAGASVARGIAAAEHLPLYSFSHQAGHISAATYSSGNPEFASSPFLAFHISGGTTDLLCVTPEKNSYKITLLGSSLDLHAGQLIDRIGVRLGLHFPCGAQLEELAIANKERYPKPKICVQGMDCHLSGAENLVEKLLSEGASKELAAAYTFGFLCDTLCAMTDSALQKYPDWPVLFAGGVMSNHIMRHVLSAHCRASFSEPAFSSDNATGTALLACRAFINRKS